MTAQPLKAPHHAWYFLLCYLTLGTCVFNFFLGEAVRPQLMVLHHLTQDQLLQHEQLTYVGLIIGVIVFGCLVDLINYRSSFILLWMIQMLGVVKLLGLSPVVYNTPQLHQLNIGLFFMGLTVGGIFAVIHPLIALIYQQPHVSKTKIMNLLHTCWPVVLILSMLFGKALVIYHLDWYWNVYGLIFFPSLFFLLAMILPLPTYSFHRHIPLSARLKSILRPGYFLLSFCMLLAITVVQSPFLWLKQLLLNFNIGSSFFILFYYGLQILFRLCAGKWAKFLSPPGLLCVGSILSVGSLYVLAIVTNPIIALIAVGVFSLSIAWYWPTFIAITVDRYPLSNGIGMAIINCAGFLAMATTIRSTERFYQTEGLNKAFITLSGYAAVTSILLTAVFFFFRSQGGYKVFANSDQSV